MAWMPAMTFMPPDAAPVWPVWPLRPVTTTRSLPPSANTRFSALISAWSPFGVPVAWATTASTSPGPMPADSWARRTTRSSQTPSGSGELGWWASASDA